MLISISGKTHRLNREFVKGQRLRKLISQRAAEVVFENINKPGKLLFERIQ